MLTLFIEELAEASTTNSDTIKSDTENNSASKDYEPLHLWSKTRSS